MTSLYQLTAEFREAAENLESLDLPEEVIRDTLEGMTGEIEVKAQNVAAVVRNLEVTAKAIKEAEADMAARRKAIENRAQAIRDYLLANMQAAGIGKIECPWFRLAVRDNPPAVVIDAANLIPLEYWTQPEPPPLQLDKKAIAKAIKGGAEVPGAHLEREKRLEIK